MMDIQRKSPNRPGVFARGEMFRHGRCYDDEELKQMVSKQITIGAVGLNGLAEESSQALINLLPSFLDAPRSRLQSSRPG